MKLSSTRRKNRVWKWINLLPAILNTVLFFGGVWNWAIGFPIALLVMTCLNYYIADTVKEFSVRKAVFGFGLFISGALNTYLYFVFISSDQGSLLVGTLSTAFSALITASVTLSCGPFNRRFKHRKKT